MLDASVPGTLIVTSEGTRLVRIAGEPLLFVSAHQSLCSITADAAALWPAFEAGMRLDDAAAQDQVDISRIISDLSSVGAVEVLSSEDGPALVAATETLGLGGTSVLVTFPDEELHQAMIPAFAHLRISPGATDEQVVMLRKGKRIGVARRDEEATWGAKDAALPLLKIALTEVLLDRNEGLALHTAILVRDDRAMLLLGEAGAGKSTLSLWLHRAGFALSGDDFAELRLDGTVRAFPFPVTLKPGAWPFFETRHGGLSSLPTYRRPDGKLARYLPIDEPSAGSIREVSWIVVLDRRSDATPAIEPLTTTETFSTLLRSAWSGDSNLEPEEFEGLAACIDGARCVRLTYSDLDVAEDMLGRFCDGDEA